jgi:hypothetical protein
MIKAPPEKQLIKLLLKSDKKLYHNLRYIQTTYPEK